MWVRKINEQEAFNRISRPTPFSPINASLAPFNTKVAVLVDTRYCCVAMVYLTTKTSLLCHDRGKLMLEIFSPMVDGGLKPEMTMRGGPNSSKSATGPTFNSCACLLRFGSFSKAFLSMSRRICSYFAPLTILRKETSSTSLVLHSSMRSM